MSQRNSLQEGTKAELGLAPVDSAAAANNGASIDKLAHEECRQVLTCVTTGSSSGTPTSFTVDAKIQDSADNSAFADVAGMTMTTVTTDNQVGEIFFDPSKVRRYFRVVVTAAFVGGTTPKVELSAAHILGNFRSTPQT
jgi:hypothetical protein